jgi:hypothetical protein
MLEKPFYSVNDTALACRPAMRTFVKVVPSCVSPLVANPKLEEEEY